MSLVDQRIEYTTSVHSYTRFAWALKLLIVIRFDQIASHGALCILKSKDRMIDSGAASYAFISNGKRRKVTFHGETRIERKRTIYNE